jgi:hypothetical protein
MSSRRAEAKASASLGDGEVARNVDHARLLADA